MGRHLRLYLFGPVRLEQNDQPIALRPRKAVALFVYLAVTAQRHSRDTLATLLWPESSQQNARASLRRALYQLNQVLPADTISATTETIELNPDAELWVDVSVFRQHVAACLPADGPVDTLAPACLTRLEEAVELYSDSFVRGFTLSDSVDFDDWQTMQRESLQRDLAGVLAQLAHTYAMQSQFDRAIGYASRWLHLDPLHEPAHRQLMQLYAWSGQRAAAVRQYEECERILDDEIGVEPAAETLDLLAFIKEGTLQAPASVEAPQESRLQRTPASPPPLPTQPPPFIGRDRELGEIGRLLREPACRLLTIVGPGGIGKTTLAMASATQWRDDRRTAVFVDLQPVQSADLLVAAIADAFNLAYAGEDNLRAQLLRYLAEKEMLLVLDNFEHLTDGVDLLSDILRRCAHITLLVTSRVALKLREEWRYWAKGMAFPDAKDVERHTITEMQTYDAVQLFLACARRVQANSDLEAEMLDVARLCRLVEGVPLAIELAATWTQVLSPAEIADEIQRDLSFLSSAMRNVPEQHRSMTVVFERSWALVRPEERKVFERLSVFRGGFERDAAIQVAGASLPVLAALVDACLLRRHSSGRYQIHALLRQYAEEQLALMPDAFDRARDLHCAYYSTFLADRFDELNGTRQREALNEIQTDLENVRTAWRRAIHRSHLANLERAAMPLHVYYTCRSRFLEGVDAFSAAVDAVEAVPPSPERNRAYAALLTCYAWLNMRIGRVSKATTLMETARSLHRSLALSPAKGMGTDPLTGLAILATVRGSYDEAMNLGHNAWQEATARGDTTNVAFAGYALASATMAQGDYEDALRYAEKTLALMQETGNRWFQNYVYQRMGQITQALGDTASALTHFKTSFAIGEEFGSAEAMAVATTYLGDVALLENDYAAAHEYYKRSLAIYDDIGNRRGRIVALAGLGVAAHNLGDHTAARRYLRTSLDVAADARIVPLTLSVLVSIGAVLVEDGVLDIGLTTLHFVDRHPAADEAQKAQVRRLLNAYGNEGAVDRAGSTEPALQPLITTLLAELAPPVSTERSSRLGHHDTAGTDPDYLQPDVK